MNTSEVAKIRKDIDAQLEAANRALRGTAVVANHQSITARMERMSVHLKALHDAGLTDVARQVCQSDDLWKETQNEISITPI